MEEQRNVKWILIVSLIMFFVSLTWGPTLYGVGYYGSRREPSLWFYINRVNVLLFVTTLTIAALFTSGFAKARTYKLAIYLFIASMGLFFITFLNWLFTYP